MPNAIAVKTLDRALHGNLAPAKVTIRIADRSLRATLAIKQGRAEVRLETEMVVPEGATLALRFFEP